MNYKKSLNTELQNLPPSGIRKFFDIVNEMQDAISLGVGEPDFVTPYSIRDAAVRSIKKGYTQYTSNLGIPLLRKRIAEYLGLRFGLDYNPESEVLVTVGASEAIDLALRAILNQGDEVIIPEPCYVSYMPCVSLSGGKAIPMPLCGEQGFKMTASGLKELLTEKTKAIIFPYPCNPTGGVMEREHLQEIVDLLKERDIFVISDEIYAELSYGERHVSIASFPKMKERTILISGFSKAFAMTGWRLGYVCAPKEVLQYLCKIHQYTIMCAPTNSQYAAIHALERGFDDGFAFVEEMKEEYDLRRRFLFSAFNQMGLKCFEPKGAFYVFPSVASSGLSGDEFAERLLFDQRVAVVPGSAFGANCKNFVRCCYASSMKNLRIAAERIEIFLGKH